MEALDPGSLRSRLDAALAADLPFSSGRVFGSMCTEPHPAARAAFQEFMHANLGNPGLCAGTNELALELGRTVAGWVGGSRDHQTLITSGASESNLTALWLAREASSSRRVICGPSVHFSVVKACQILGLDLTLVDLDDQFRLDPDGVEKELARGAAAVVATACTTELGAIDPIDALSPICGDAGIPLHVDAALGGLVFPFLDPALEGWGFDVEGVTSVATDPHKMGLAPPPCGVLVLHPELSLDLISVETPYLTSKAHTSILSTRASGAVAAAWAALRSLGDAGYQEMVRRCLELRDLLVEGLTRMNLEVVSRSRAPLVAVKVAQLDSTLQALEGRGWNVSRTRSPEALRLVVMPHVGQQQVEHFLSTLDEVIIELEASA